MRIPRCFQPVLDDKEHTRVYEARLCLLARELQYLQRQLLVSVL